MTTNKEIGQRIQARRKELKMSQEELAKKVGFKSRSSINKIEKDGRRINPEKLEIFATALDTTVDYLMGLEIIDIRIEYDEETVKRLQNIFSTYYDKLTEENKKNAEDYLKFLLEKQN